MASEREYLRWHCKACRYEEQTAVAELFQRLQKLGLMKRADEPDLAVALELARSSVQRSPCPRCKGNDFAPELCTQADDDEDWGDPKPCSACGKLIPAERIALFPEVELCTKCQQRLDSGNTTAVDDYCPHCGTPMTMRQGRGPGLTRYELICPSCRR